MAVHSLSIFTTLSSTLLQSGETDCSGAATNEQVQGMIDQLCHEHGRFYTANNIHWMSWATWILSKDAGKQERLATSAPPEKYIHLF